MRKYNEEEDLYLLSDKHGTALVTQNKEEIDDWKGYWNGEFFISGSLGEVCRYMEGFIYALDYYEI